LSQLSYNVASFCRYQALASEGLTGGFRAAQTRKYAPNAQRTSAAFVATEAMDTPKCPETAFMNQAISRASARPELDDETLTKEGDLRMEQIRAAQDSCNAHIETKSRKRVLKRSKDAAKALKCQKADANALTNKHFVKEFGTPALPRPLEEKRMVGCAFGSTSARLAGTVPGESLKGSHAESSSEELLRVRVRRDIKPSESEGRYESKNACSDSSDCSFISWDHDVSVRDREDSAVKFESACSSRTRVSERMIRRESDGQGQVVEVVVTRARPAMQVSTGTVFDASQGDKLIFPRQGKGALKFGPTKSQPASVAKPSVGTWQAVAEISRFGMKLPDTHYSAVSPSALRQEVLQMSDTEFVRATEAIGNAILQAERTDSLPAPQGISPHGDFNTILQASNTASNSSSIPQMVGQPRVKGGPVIREESLESKAARAKKRAAENLRQPDWYKTQLHSCNADDHGPRHVSRVPSAVAFGSAVPSTVTAGNRRDTAVDLHSALGALPLDETYNAMNSMKAFEATMGVRAPAFTFAAPDCRTVPERYAGSRHLSNRTAIYKAQDGLTEALHSVRALQSLPLAPSTATTLSASDFDRPDRRTAPKFSFPTERCNMQADQLIDDELAFFGVEGCLGAFVAQNTDACMDMGLQAKQLAKLGRNFPHSARVAKLRSATPLAAENVAASKVVSCADVWSNGKASSEQAVDGEVHAFLAAVHRTSTADDR
jgi:hypothetical protein